MSSDVRIKVEGLSKCYQIYEHPRDRLKQFVLPHVSRFVGQKQRRYYREFWALREISFEVQKGETVAIVGRNGSGKSTLLQMICGTLTPTSGKAETYGRVAALLELGSGFNPEFSGRENVYLNASVLGLRKEQIDERFNAIAAFADIGDFLEQPVKTYSSGMLMRLAFAVIAHVDADILVIDEALAVGDAFFTQKCMRFLRTFMQSGTVLFVSHDTNAILSLCNRALFISNGSLKLMSTPKNVVEQYMAELYEENQAIGGSQSLEPPPNKQPAAMTQTVRDMRADYVNASGLRNDIEIFHFDPNCAAFGTGHARIISVRLLDSEQRPLSWIIGGEEVTLEVECRAIRPLARPIIGFYINDRLGQQLFGDNTYLVYREKPKVVPGGGKVSARFTFVLPLLPPGDYVINAAIADGTQEDHVQHHWMHDALAFRVHASTVRFGLVGVPMKSILLQTDS